MSSCGCVILYVMRLSGPERRLLPVGKPLSVLSGHHCHIVANWASSRSDNKTPLVVIKPLFACETPLRLTVMALHCKYTFIYQQMAQWEMVNIIREEYADQTPPQCKCENKFSCLLSTS